MRIDNYLQNFLEKLFYLWIHDHKLLAKIEQLDQLN